jgi:hypothetical protein
MPPLFAATVAGSLLALSGCVAGYGRCLFLQPSRVDLQGTVHWRTPERIAVLSLPKSAYVYAPARSLQCRPMQDVELEFSADPPETLVANARVRVHGSLYESTSDRHRTPFVLSVETLEVLH